jgi:membrane-associated PAP2 superfamily phosphatase
MTIYHLLGDLNTVVLQEAKVVMKIILVLITLDNILIRSWFGRKQTCCNRNSPYIFVVIVITTKLILLFLNLTVNV